MLYIPFFFFFNDTATTEIYTLSLHDALPIFLLGRLEPAEVVPPDGPVLAPVVLEQLPDDPPLVALRRAREQDRKSTRLNSSHANISYAVFCLKKKTNPT